MTTIHRDSSRKATVLRHVGIRKIHSFISNYICSVYLRSMTFLAFWIFKRENTHRCKVKNRAHKFVSTINHDVVSRARTDTLFPDPRIFLQCGMHK